MKTSQLTAHEILEQYSAKKLSSASVCDAVWQEIDQKEKDIHAYAEVFPKESAIINYDGNNCPIPVAIKDNICIASKATTCCSKILKGFVAPYDATVIEKLKNSSAIFVGHANMDEFAFGSSTETSCYGPTRNPCDLSRVPGGSSGGSVAAVAGNEAIWSLGSDTGGSIRQPAAYCGVVGLKPTYGRVSRYGLIAFASSLDQIGPVTKDVTDSALLLNIIAGHDPKDSTSANVLVPDYTKSLINNVKGLKIGLPKEYFIEGLDAEVKAKVMDAVALLKSLGAEFKEISLPHSKYAIACYYIVATAEASSNLGRFDGVQYGLRVQPSKTRKTNIVDMYEETRDQGFGAEAKRRIMLGTYSLSSGYYDAYYLKGLKVRTMIKNDFDRAFEDVDAIITPTAPTTAFKLGAKMNDPISMYLNDIFTTPANLSGIPAISVPCGNSKENLPIGLQIMAKPFAEEMLFRIAYTYEKNKV
ncbi:MAG: Asp-tRNA(Asn)/Glu-tRNA(Gln) amidotransferase subunit GatA [Candidatus Omnitrophica bacterium]|nr:Asp-tRNA(Asn)/Glu-tRNA(Gln) amidotransferase subunit GatA [Candidatus Omnitrophota bacterium]